MFHNLNNVVFNFFLYFPVGLWDAGTRGQVNTVTSLRVDLTTHGAFNLRAVSLALLLLFLRLSIQLSSSRERRGSKTDCEKRYLRSSAVLMDPLVETEQALSR